MRLSGTHIVVGLLAATLTLMAPESAITLGGIWPGQREELTSPTVEPQPPRPATVAPAGVGASAVTNVRGIIVPRSNPGVKMPIFRFYSAKSGTHFYTPSAEERDIVIARWSNVWSYEGIAYYVNPAKNNQPLYRFYNRANGSHFYTASANERDMVFAKWMNVFTYDGPTYAVTPYAESGKAPVWRFYNKKNGSHFYTASAEEADIVIARWSAIYQLEGVAFWLGQ